MGRPTALWNVEKGEIIGSTVDNPLKKNTFLIYRGEEVGDPGKTPRFTFSQWNDYEIIAIEDSSVHKINGMVTVGCGGPGSVSPSERLHWLSA